MCCAERWPRSPGLLLTARLETGEANIGASMPLEFDRGLRHRRRQPARRRRQRRATSCSARIFIGLIQNGMDLAQIQSYLQEVVIGVLLILAVIADQLRQFVMLRLKD